MYLLLRHGERCRGENENSPETHGAVCRPLRGKRGKMTAPVRGARPIFLALRKDYLMNAFEVVPVVSTVLMR